MLELPRMKLRTFQSRALKELFRNPTSHVVVLAPTGMGKSLIFERAATWHHRRVLLISPLLALSRQHSSKLKQYGLHVLNCFGDEHELPLPTDPSYVWILSPEKIFNPHSTRILDTIIDNNPNLVVVDECHLMMEWGKSFRPSLYEIPNLVNHLPQVSSLWLTASLPPHDRKEFFSQLPNNFTLIDEFALPKKLSLIVRQTPWSKRIELLESLLEDLLREGEGIIFVPTRKWAVKIARYLQESFQKRFRNEDGAPQICASYHAGLSKEERLNIEKQFREKRLSFIVSTSAFGLGMDISHLFWTVLWQAPLSLSALAQSMGRVGRNNKDGVAVVLWDFEDFHNLKWATENNSDKERDLKEVYDFVTDDGCRIDFLLRNFKSQKKSKPVSTACGRCDLCLSKRDHLLH